MSQRPIRRHILLLLLLACFTTSNLILPARAATEGIALPDIGGSSVSLNEEHRIGEAAFNTIREAHALLDDPLIEHYIQSLGYRLVSSGDAQDFRFHYFVVNDSGINAFAMPGGYIGINYGLILDTQSESELAAVVAHETAHVTQHHYARSYDALKGSSLTATAALIAAILLGGSNDQLGQAAAASIAAGSVQKQIDFTRANEKEADRIGIQLLENAGFDPNSMASFFERMQRSTRLYGAEAPEFLRTHPVTTARIADARNRARQYPKHKVVDHKAYFLIRARIRALTSQDPAATLREFRKNLTTGSYLDKDAENYGYALTLIANNDNTQALSILERLHAADPQRLAYIIARAHALTGARKTDKALAQLRDALTLNPHNPILSHYYASTLLQAGRAQDAIRFLQDFIGSTQPQPQTYQLLAQAQGQAGRGVDAQMSMAEFYAAYGQLHQAIQLLEQAQRSTGLDFYHRSRIEARLKDLKLAASAQTPSK